LTFLGEARYQVRLRVSDLSVCESTSKTAEKLALNLIELIVTPEEIEEGCTIYGNKQFKLKALDEKRRKALRSKYISQFEEKIDWYITNDTA
jgi:hypothetical protein